MKIIIAWIKKYIFHIESPSTLWAGYKYEYDYLVKEKYGFSQRKRRNADKKDILGN